ncbi:MAG: hypothetical protein WC551_08615 [Patescibacteria group bacterium]
MTVYIVFSGEFSDRGVAAVFTDETMAKNYCKFFGGDYEYQIEEYDTDVENPNPEGLSAYRVYLTRDGDVHHAVPMSFAEAEKLKNTVSFHEKGPEEEDGFWRRRNRFWVGPGRKYMMAYCFAQTEDEAIARQQARRVAIIRAGLWETGTCINFPEAT